MNLFNNLNVCEKELVCSKNTPCFVPAYNFYAKPLKAILEDRLKTWCKEEDCSVPVVEVLDAALEENSSFIKLMRSIGNTNNGAAFGTVYDISQKKDDIKTMHFQDFSIGIPFVRVLRKIFNEFNSISVLTLQNCSLDADAIMQIACTLNHVQDLNLDENPSLDQNYDCLLTNNNTLKHLSLKFCAIDAIGTYRLAEALEFRVPKVQQLLSLDLTSNHIDSDGAKGLAKALRTNRDLVSLSLTNNWIGDDGAIALASVLQKFVLTEQEIDLRLERQLQMLLKKKDLMEELYVPVPIEELKSASVSKTEQKKATKQVSSKEFNKSRSKSSKIDKTIRSRETVTSKLGNEINNALLAAEVAAEAMMYPDPYPLLSNSYQEDNIFYCPGNFHLGHLSIAYNKITEDGLNSFLDALNYQHIAVPSESIKGIFRCNVEGNIVSSDNHCVAAINEILTIKTTNGKETADTELLESEREAGSAELSVKT